MSVTDMDLFGGTRPWKSDDWTASDDRVRGGKSQSYFDCSSSSGVGRFYGELDIKTLGGAGFASQRTTGEDRTWNLSDHSGIVLDIAEADSKRYTFILKDEMLPRSPNGREQATISYEYDFEVPVKVAADEKQTSKASIFIPWSSLKPTYRGKEKKDAQPLDLTSVKRVSIMMRSFFGDQEGPFSLKISCIKAVATPPASSYLDLEQGNSSIVERKSSCRRWCSSIALSLSPWRLCGCAFLVVAFCYFQGYFPTCLHNSI